MANLLFICSKNKWRSPTAELLFKNHAIHHARSAGTSDKARIRVNQKTINWVDLIFVMERKHQQILKQKFGASLATKLIVVLAIKDDYQFNDPELIRILKIALYEYL